MVLAALVAGNQQPITVRPKASVEVLDSTAQVDDVISKLRAKKETAKPDIKRDRPPLPPEAAPVRPKPGNEDDSRKEQRRDRRGQRDPDRFHRH
jgi:hypothetical protein